MKNSASALPLENRLLGYSITATAVLAGTVQAQISGTEVNATIDNTHPYTINFNSNPRFVLSRSGYGNSAYGLIKRTSSTAAGWKVGPMALSEGANVGASGSWYVPGGNSNRTFIYVGNRSYTHRHYYTNTHTYKTHTTSGTVTNSHTKTYKTYSHTTHTTSKEVTNAGSSFVGKGDKYIGVKFNIGGEQKYGWIKINVPDGASLRSGGYTIISYAYEQSGSSINCDGVLPVELTSFTASILNGSANLKWKTATEINNYGFDIERNTYPEFKDGKKEQTNNWEKIGFVEGSGNSSSEKNYSFTDPNPPSGLVLYRLKQIDADGNYKYYSQLAEVNNNLMDVKETKLPTEYSLLQNYPNPFNPATNIKYSIPKEGMVTIKVYDMLGSEVTTLVNENKPAGNYQVMFDGSNLASGTYLYRITTGSFTASKKFILVK